MLLVSVLSVLEMAVERYDCSLPMCVRGGYAVEPPAQGTTHEELTGRQIPFKPRKNFLAKREFQCFLGAG